MKKIIMNVMCGLSVLFLLWIGASFIDIVADNTTGEASHSQYNAFVVGFGD